jgi:hypothetical protein
MISSLIFYHRCRDDLNGCHCRVEDEAEAVHDSWCVMRENESRQEYEPEDAIQ